MLDLSAFMLVPKKGYKETIERITNLEAKIEQLERLCFCTNKFAHYPDWIDKHKAFEITQIKDLRTLGRYVDLGVIEAHQKDATGAMLYSKADCMKYAIKYEEITLTNPSKVA